MSDGVLTILKFCLLALLYLFLARVVWTVTSDGAACLAIVSCAAILALAPTR